MSALPKATAKIKTICAGTDTAPSPSSADRVRPGQGAGFQVVLGLAGLDRGEYLFDPGGDRPAWRGLGHAAHVEDTTIGGLFVRLVRAGQLLVQPLARAKASHDQRRLIGMPELLPDAPRDLHNRHGRERVGEEDRE